MKLKYSGDNIKIKNIKDNINPLNDFLFSKIFGEKGCEEELLYLINVFTKKNFKNLSIAMNEFKGQFKDNKKSIVDVLAVMNEGTIVNVESQIEKQKNFHKRSHFYSSKIHSVFLEVGKNYENLPMLIMLNLLEFNFTKSNEYHSKFVLCDIEHREYILEDLLESHYIELPKFRKLIKEENIDLNEKEIRLLLFLDKKTPQYLIEKVIKMDETINKMHKKIENILQTKNEYLAYIKAEMAERDYENTISYAEEKGEKKGKKEGKKEGRKEGIIEIANNLKTQGIDIQQIAKATGLKIEEIEKL